MRNDCFFYSLLRLSLVAEAVKVSYHFIGKSKQEEVLGKDELGERE